MNIYGLSYFNYIIRTILYLKNYLNETVSQRYKQLSSDTIVFFQNNPTPYFLSYIDIHNKNNGVIVWKYNISNKRRPISGN